MTTITGEFEAERAEDSENVKQVRFDKILNVMQEMQELGHPPKEIVGEIVSKTLGQFYGLQMTNIVPLRIILREMSRKVIII